MPKIFDVDFSAITEVNSISAASVNSFENVCFNDLGQNFLIGGGFKGYNNYDGGIIRLLTGGTKDTSFDTGVGVLETIEDFTTRIIRDITIDNVDDYYLVGTFKTFNNVLKNNIVKLKNDGTIDETFNTGTGFNGNLFAVKIDSNGKILVGGSFTTYNGQTQNRLIRLNTDGTIDNTLQIGTGFNSTVNTINIDSSNRIYVGGSFTDYSGVTTQRIIRIDSGGTIDNTFSYSSAFNDVVYRIVFDSTEKLYVGGNFTTFSGVSSPRIVKLNTDGTRDSSFSVGSGFNTGSGFEPGVYGIAVDSSDRVYCVGNFTTYNGATNVNVIKLDTNGTKDASFNNTNKFLTTNALDMRSVAIDSDGKIFIGGSFTTYNLQFDASGIVKVDTSGTIDTSFSSLGANIMSLSKACHVIKFDSSNKIILGGSFNGYKIPTCLVSISSYDTKVNPNYDPHYGFTISTSINALAVFDFIKIQDGTLYPVGTFENYTLYSSNHRSIGITGLNSGGTVNSSVSVSTGANSTIRNIYQDNAGGIFITGDFTNYKGSGVPRMVKITSGATIDGSFTTAGLQSVSGSKLAFDSSNNIYLGGAFTTFSGQTNNRIIKLFQTGFKDTSFDNTIGFNSDVTTIMVDPYGKILVGGFFTQYKGNTENYIIRLNPDGTKDNTFDNSIGFDTLVWDIQMWGDKIYVGGRFTTYKNKPYGKIIRLNYDGTIDETFKSENKMNAFQVTGVICDIDGFVYVYGTDLNYNNYGLAKIVKINPNGEKDLLFNSDNTFFRPNSYTNFAQIRKVIFI